MKTEHTIISKKEDYENYSYIENMLFDFNPENSLDLNNNIDQMREKFEKLSIKFKKDSFGLIKSNFLKILNNENAGKIINSLNPRNRKFFEKVIICENLEEYTLLNHVSETKKQNSLFKEIGISLEEEYEKNKMICECLLSSRSWKLTRFLRIKDLLHR